VKYLQRKL